MMKNKINESLPTILIAHFSNPEHISPIFDAIHLLSKEFNLIIVHRNAKSLGYSYPENVIVYKVGSELKLDKKSSPAKTFFDYCLFVFKIGYELLHDNASLLFCYDMHAFVAGFIANKLTKSIPIVYHQNETKLLSEVPKKSTFLYWLKYLEICFSKSIEILSFVEPNRAELFFKEAEFKKEVIIIENCPRKLKDLPKQSEIIASLKKDNNRIVLHRGPIGDGSTLDIHPAIRSVKFWPSDVIFVIQGFRLKKEEESCKSVINEENLQGRVVFLPFYTDYREVLKITVGADLGVVLYKPYEINRRHANPVKFYDYIACGVPVVVPKVMPFICNVAVSLGIGTCYEESTPESIGEAVTSILNNPERNKMGERARNEHLKRLNFEEQFSPMLIAIKETIKTKCLK